jgi:subtilisin family serine protease
MKKLLFASLSLAIFGAAFADQPVQFVEVRGVKEFTGELIVRPLQSLRGAAMEAAVSRIRTNVLRGYPETGEFIVRPPLGLNENQYADILMQSGDYQYVEPNWRVYPLRNPNDSQFSGQWHHPTIRTPQAWDLHTGETGIITAYTDTGVDLTHPDLRNLLVPGYNSVDQVRQVDGGRVNDINGHGTHVAGIGAAQGNNAIGVAGVGWGFRIMPIRVSNDAGGGSSIEWLTRGARWAVDNGAKVISASYSGVDSSAIQTTGTYIKTRGGLYLYAAGNDNRNLSGFDHTDVVVVGATDRGDVKASFSAYGRAVDVFAPGVDILATFNGGGYGRLSGTSMATPMANGVAALIWSSNPRLVVGQVETLLFITCRDLGAAGNDDYWGWGRVDAYEGVRRAMVTASARFAP